MLTVGRSWSVGSEYRYGFNGKESDPETYGDGNIYDYGFRIYDPRIGRFLSVDPLTQSYPWYTPYQFAGNKPINSMDLDGLEEIEVVAQSPSYGQLGEATITITIDYIVVSVGPGAIDPHKINQINVQQFKALFSKGDIDNLRLKTLPSPTTEAVEYFGPDLMASPWFEKKGRISQIYYNTKITYDANISCNAQIDLCEAIDWVSQNPTGRGLVFQPSPEAAASIGIVQNQATVETFTLLFNNAALNSPSFYNPYTGAAGFNEGIFTGAPGFNLIAINSKYITSSDPLFADFTEQVGHEAGHNFARSARHGTGHYEYNQTGLQSNEKGKVFPTKKNTFNIINDLFNRQKIK